MASHTGSLTQVAVKNAKPGAKPVRLFDGGGLYLEILPQGGRYWRLKYRVPGPNGKPLEKRLALGVYPEVSLADAREARDAARTAIKAGRDPGAERKADKLKAREAGGNTFKAVAVEWLTKQTKYSPASIAKANWMLDSFLLPHLGTLPIAKVNAPVLLAALRRIETQGLLETANRARSLCSRIFRYAVATGRAERDPAVDLKGAIALPNKKSHAAITDPKRFGALLNAIDGYEGQPSVRYALRLQPYLFQRPGELRFAQWSEIDLQGDKPEWRIPGHRMKVKTKEAHIVPLPKQAVRLLRELHKLTGDSKLVFPGTGAAGTPISENTLNKALFLLGYKDKMTAHGFRTTASTLLNEMGYNADWIERQLAHAPRNQVRGTYNLAQYLPERRKMLQGWADYLDGLRNAGTVVPIRKKAS